MLAVGVFFAKLVVIIPEINGKYKKIMMNLKFVFIGNIKANSTTVIDAFFAGYKVKIYS